MCSVCFQLNNMNQINKHTIQKVRVPQPTGFPKCLISAFSLHVSLTGMTFENDGRGADEE